MGDTETTGSAGGRLPQYRDDQDVYRQQTRQARRDSVFFKNVCKRGGW
jgi:hypothetical protein